LPGDNVWEVITSRFPPPEGQQSHVLFSNEQVNKSETFEDLGVDSGGHMALQFLPWDAIVRRSKGNTMQGAWVGDERYIVREGDGTYLKTVWWMEIGLTVADVAPGTYRADWELQFRNTCGLSDTTCTVTSEHGSIISKQLSLNMSNGIGRVVVGTITVDETGSVHAGMRNTDGSKGGLVWNEFTLTPLDENLNPVLEPDDEERESLFQHKSLSVSSSS